MHHKTSILNLEAIDGESDESYIDRYRDTFARSGVTVTHEERVGDLADAIEAHVSNGQLFGETYDRGALDNMLGEIPEDRWDTYPSEDMKLDYTFAFNAR